jgi:hypothetical protein
MPPSGFVLSRVAIIDLGIRATSTHVSPPLPLRDDLRHRTRVMSISLPLSYQLYRLISG